MAVREDKVTVTVDTKMATVAVNLFQQYALSASFLRARSFLHFSLAVLVFCVHFQAISFNLRHFTSCWSKLPSDRLFGEKSECHKTTLSFGY
ncbi:hypothetical protein BaRGS_00005097 [Batillaria attramentaria]|uniref:Uncharacterized protein n=1 Tax=Batillaria attramentaria TaxID=370345 RepID=A0ABD0LVX8_9CAEN